jgi:uncharacterized membrane protein YccC
MNTCPERPDAMNRIFRTLVLCATAFLLLQLISLYLDWQSQMILGGAMVLLALVANRISSSRVVTLALMLLSITATGGGASTPWWTSCQTNPTATCTWMRSSCSSSSGPKSTPS